MYANRTNKAHGKEKKDMKRESLEKMFKEYSRHWNVLSCVGDHPKTVELREKREKRLQRVKKIIDLAEECESPKEFLEDIALSKEITEKAMSEESFH